MSKCAWLLASLVGFLGPWSERVWTTEEKGSSPAPRWLSDWEEGRKVARESGRPLFVVFRCEH